METFLDTWTGSALLLHKSQEYSWASLKGTAISISQDWLLMHGKMLYPIISTSKAILKFIMTMKPGRLTSVPDELARKLEFLVMRELRTGITQHTGKVVFAWICPLLTHTFEQHFREWNFHERDVAVPHYLQLFLLVRIDSHQPLANISTAEQALHFLRSQASLQTLTRGMSVEIVSVPFGNMSFINSVAQGIISNFIGSFIMTDAYVFPKSEGSPVYVVSPNRRSRSLVGMVIATMIWCRGEWVHYTFAANLEPCLSAILHERHHPQPLIKPVICHDTSNALDRGVVMITCGAHKGTGIFVDKDTGTFLTCSHVIEEASEREISITVFKDVVQSRMPAKLLFRNTNATPYDIAVLKVNPRKLDPSLEPVQFSDAPIMQGEPVVAVGFSLFLSTQPTLSSGVVSKSLDCILATTCSVQSGFSGGPIFSLTTGKMLGMIVSNIESVDKRVHFQRISLSVPVAVLSKPLRQYLLTNNVRMLLPLVTNDSKVQGIWNLEYHLPSKL